MIICSNKNNIQIRSTEEILEIFDLSESELIWYIKATELQLSSPGCRDIKFMGREVRCSYSVEDPVEADFELILRNKGKIHILVALDFKRIVLFTTINNYSYEIWLGYKCGETEYNFREESYEVSCFRGNDDKGFA